MNFIVTVEDGTVSYKASIADKVLHHIDDVPLTYKMFMMSYSFRQNISHEDFLKILEIKKQIKPMEASTLYKLWAKI